MSIIRPDDMCALLAFYVEAGVDAVLEEAPVDRLTAWAQEPQSSPAAKGPPSPPRPPQTRAPRGRVHRTIQIRLFSKKRAKKAACAALRLHEPYLALTPESQLRRWFRNRPGRNIFASPNFAEVTHGRLF